MAAQVCALNKCLMSVSKIAKAGHRVVFDGEGSYIYDKVTKKVIWMEEKNGMYSVEMRVSTSESQQAPVFRRPGM